MFRGKVRENGREECWEVVGSGKLGWAQIPKVLIGRTGVKWLASAMVI